MIPERCSVDAYLAEVLATIAPLAAERVALGEAFGRVLAEPLRAVQPIPLFDNSAMDGYAVRDADVADGTRDEPVRLRVSATILAGSPVDTMVGPGEAVRIMTGGPIPPGADRVIPVEASLSGRFDDSGFVDVWSGGKTHIRRAGEDVPAESALFDAGHTIGARDVGLLAATGHASVRVVRRPRVAIVSTGDELAGAGATSALPGARIPDSNALYLDAAVRSLGAEVSTCLRAPDDVRMLEAALDRAAAGADLIVSTGGLGAGSHDLVRQAIVSGTGAGTAGRVASVDMKPGRPQAHGAWHGVPWIALPGNPTAAFVSFESFVRPAIGRLNGARSCAAPDPIPLSAGWSAPAGATRFVPLVVVDRGGESAVTAAGTPHASHSIAAMFGAALIGVVPADVERVRAGDVVRVFEPA